MLFISLNRVSFFPGSVRTLTSSAVVRQRRWGLDFSLWVLQGGASVVKSRVSFLPLFLMAARGAPAAAAAAPAAAAAAAAAAGGGGGLEL